MITKTNRTLIARGGKPLSFILMQRRFSRDNDKQTCVSSSYTDSHFRKPECLRYIFITALSVIIFSACNSNSGKDKGSGNVQQQTTVDTLADNAKAEWEKFKADADQSIAETRDSIEVFKKKVDKLSGKAKLKYEKEVARLEQKNDELKSKLDNYKDEGKEKWEAFKNDFNHDMQELKSWLKDSTDVHQKKS